MIIADDLGTNDVGWVNRNNANDIHTPVLDELVTQGVHLSNFYVQPVCGPSRAALLTGRYPIRLGLQHGNLLPEQENGLPTNETTFPAELQKLGYVTYGIGKWHLGHWKRDLIPTARGFNRWYGFLEGAQDHFKHTDHCGGVPGLDLWEDDRPDMTQRGVYSTDLFTSKAEQFLTEHSASWPSVPFFLYLAYSAVHTPLQAPEQALARYSHLPNKKRATYAAMLHVMDEGIGRVADTLSKLGFMDSSVLVFMSDNGGPTQEGASNWPLRGWKGSLWEGGIRSQALVVSSLLPQGARGRSWGGLSHITDMMPTLLGLAGGSPPEHLDGVNFWEELINDRPSPRTEILHNVDTVGLCTEERLAAGTPCDSDWAGVSISAIRVGDWKLIRRLPGTPASRKWHDRWVPPSSLAPGWQPPEEQLRASSAPDCGPCTFEEDAAEHGFQVCLFNITEDPEERCDRAAFDPPFDVLSGMLARLEEYESSAAPVRYPRRVPGKCDPRRFGNVFQWWSESDGSPARRLVSQEYRSPQSSEEPTSPAGFGAAR